MRMSTLDKKLKHIKAIILDMDGVLVDTEPIHFDSFKVFLDELNIGYDDEFIESFIGYSVDDNIRSINNKLPVNQQMPLNEGIKNRDLIYLDLVMRNHLLPIKGISKIVDYCQKTDKKIALASSSVREQVEAILQKISVTNLAGINFSDVFESVVSGDDVPEKKPAADIYLKTLQNLNLDGSECVAIEDSLAGILSASRTGIKVFGLRNPYIDPKNLAKADFIIDRPDDILGYLT